MTDDSSTEQSQPSDGFVWLCRRRGKQSRKRFQAIADRVGVEKVGIVLTFQDDVPCRLRGVDE